MKIRKKMVGEVAVVVLNGHLDSQSAPEVQDHLSKIVVDAPDVLIDLTDVPCVSSAGLRTLLLVYRKAQGMDHSVGVVGMSDELRDVLDATGFLGFFTVADSVASGVAVLEADSQRELTREHATSST